MFYFIYWFNERQKSSFEIKLKHMKILSKLTMLLLIGSSLTAVSAQTFMVSPSCSPVVGGLGYIGGSFPNFTDNRYIPADPSRVGPLVTDPSTWVIIDGPYTTLPITCPINVPIIWPPVMPVVDPPNWMIGDPIILPPVVPVGDPLNGIVGPISFPGFLGDFEVPGSSIPEFEIILSPVGDDIQLSSLTNIPEPSSTLLILSAGMLTFLRKKR